MVPLFNVSVWKGVRVFSREQEKNETKNIMKLMERVSNSGAWRKIESGKKRVCVFLLVLEALWLSIRKTGEKGKCAYRIRE